MSSRRIGLKQIYNHHWWQPNLASGNSRVDSIGTNKLIGDMWGTINLFYKNHSYDKSSQNCK